ncbi:hypothetical protein [Pseudomonas sp. NPDC089534]|uniref:hypothetical protein n=1 Tax=Pseudomonas sp. NPDC089534 TaxID=3364468 RepID=UPI0037FE1035
MGDGVAAKIDNAHEPGLKSAGEIPFRIGITAGMARINQPLGKEKSPLEAKNSMAIITKAQCIAKGTVLQTLRRPTKGGTTFSGRGAIPHRR